MESVKLKVESKRHEFDFENLSVYQKGLRFVNAIFALSDQLPARVQCMMSCALPASSYVGCSADSLTLLASRTFTLHFPLYTAFEIPR